MADEAGGNYEEKADAAPDEAGFVRSWLEALKRAEDEEKDWVKQAERALETFRGKRKSGGRSFNIFHSNIETIVPAVYNSTPVPDVRRRFADPDKASKTVSDLLERALSFSVDSYDFDGLMKRAIKDGEVTGRGQARVRYLPTFGEGEQVTYEEVACDYVPWRYFRRGPGRTWADVPWIAYADFLTREELRKLCGDAKDAQGNAICEEVPLNYEATESDKKKPGTQEGSIFRRAMVWQIWDKDAREVISICPDYREAVLARVPDPLNLQGFFPSPRPYQPILATDSLVPVVPYDVYEDLALELNEVTARIAKLVKQLRPRGGYGGQAHEIKAMAEADDGELVPLSSADHLAQMGGVDKAITWFPMEPIVLALKQLLEQREAIKQTIYEVTGIADIMRGATEASETATAQQIKAQWGSLRIQERQAEAARFARDLFRLKAEIIAEKFSIDTLSRMTGIAVPAQQEQQQAQQQAALAQQQGQPVPPEVGKLLEATPREAVEPILRSDVLRAYRIDIESDSTVRGDLSRNQQVMAEFISGTAQYAQAMGPLVQLNQGILPFVLQLYGAFTRQFKLGKQAEDELEKLIEAAAQPQPEQPNPALEAEKAKAEASKQQTKLDMEVATAKHGMDMEKMQAERAADQQKFGLEQQRFGLDQQRFAMQQQAVQQQPNGGVRQ